MIIHGSKFRIRAKSQGMALSLGDKINQTQKSRWFCLSNNICITDVFPFQSTQETTSCSGIRHLPWVGQPVLTSRPVITPWTPSLAECRQHCYYVMNIWVGQTGFIWHFCILRDVMRHRNCIYWNRIHVCILRNRCLLAECVIAIRNTWKQKQGLHNTASLLKWLQYSDV